LNAAPLGLGQFLAYLWGLATPATVINLAPADLKKGAGGIDLPIALALEGAPDIRAAHVTEAVGYRSLDRKLWAR
jgi:predicted ATPase with chaperone activity